jgi:hypothetical protein
MVMATIELTREAISQLRFLDTTGLKPGEYEFPDFLIIGPQRTGTTWLKKNLGDHAQIFMSSPKELHFFNYLILKEKGGRFYHSDRLEWYSNNFKLDLRNFVKKNLWNIKYFKTIQARDLNYRQFCSALVKGEATASYAAMDGCLINEITTLHPDIKVIMLIRHPVDRAWSHAKKDLLLVRNRSLEEVDFAEFVELYTDEFQLKCGRYTDIIDKWRKYVRPDNFFVGFFSDISNDPNGLLKRILNFLGVESDLRHLKNGSASNVINPTADLKVPERHQEFLRQLFAQEITALNRTFNLSW